MENRPFHVTAETLTLDMVGDLLAHPEHPIELSVSAVQAIQNCRAFLDKRIAEKGAPIYGINTGFGYLSDTFIKDGDLTRLQENLIRSHACGMGDLVPESIVRLMIFLKVKSLSFGHSGVSLPLAQRLIDFYNAGVIPVVYTQGSLGASGDLAPLAHLSLPLLGEGEVVWKGKRMPSADVLKELGWEPLKLLPKEGLALLNGTQFMLAYGLWILLKAQQYADWADTFAAISLDAFDGRTEPFDPLLHKIRAHTGQVETAIRLRGLLKGSEIASQPKAHVQDPYCFRCVPQVHGASRDALGYASQVFSTEMNSVSDNPNIFPEEGKILSGGNFHGQPLALALDFLSIALAELGSISERRGFQLQSGSRELPLFLTPNPGLNSGLMIVQYTAAGIASENKQLCMPSSVDTIPSSNGQEDHVSMGANAAVKCLRVLNNLRSILGIELLTASQAIHFREPKKTSPILTEVLAIFRKKIPILNEDRILSPELLAAASFLDAHSPPEINH